MNEKIIAWSLTVVWANGESEQILDVPSHISQDIEEFLNLLEEQN
jgi:hypothetical protein